MNGYCKARKCNEAMEFFFSFFSVSKIKGMGISFDDEEGEERDRI
jgi:pentatricopeptide repeat protein